MKEMFGLIGEKLEAQELFPLVPAGLVITGGGAKTNKIVEVAKRTLGLPARMGQPMALPGLLSDIQDPVFATSVGLLVFASKREGVTTQSDFSISDLFKNLSFANLKQQMHRLVKLLLP